MTPFLKSFFRAFSGLSKTYHPFIFPFYYFAAHSFYQIRFYLLRIIFSSRYPSQTIQQLNHLHKYGFVAIENFLEQESFDALSNEVRDLQVLLMAKGPSNIDFHSLFGFTFFC